MDTATTTCAQCGVVARGRAARFCARCGADLEVGGPSAHGAAPPGVRWTAPVSRNARTWLVLLVGVGLIAVTAASPGDLRDALDGSGVSDAGQTDREPHDDSPGGGPEGDVVELDPSTPSIDPHDEAGPGPEPVADPGPLRCEPDGCDAWQLTAPSGELAGSAGVLYALDAGQLTARSGPFGTERWSTSLHDLAPVTGDGDAIAGFGDPGEPELLRADPEGVVVVLPQAVVRHDRQGTRQWLHRVGGWPVWDAVAAAGRHLVIRSRISDGSVPFGRVGVLDLDDGSERWTRQVAQIYGITDELLLAGGLTGGVAAFDLDDGSSLWELTISRQVAIRVVGPVIHLDPIFPQARPRGRLLDPATGETPVHLAGGVLHPPVRMGERFVTVLQGPTTDDGISDVAARVVALGADGSLAWVHELASADDADPDEAVTTVALYDLGDGSRIVVGMGADRTSLRLLDGEVLEQSVPTVPGAPMDTSIHAQGGTNDPGRVRSDWRTASDGLSVREGADRLQIRAPGGTVVTVRGPAPALVATDPVVVRGGSRLLGLRLDGPS